MRENSIKNRFLAPLLGPRVDFWSILETRLGPAGSPNTLRDVPGTLQILPKSPPCLKKCPDRLPGGSGKVPGHPQGPPRTPQEPPKSNLVSVVLNNHDLLVNIFVESSPEAIKKMQEVAPTDFAAANAVRSARHHAAWAALRHRAGLRAALCLPRSPAAASRSDLSPRWRP